MMSKQNLKKKKKMKLLLNILFFQLFFHVRIVELERVGYIEEHSSQWLTNVDQVWAVGAAARRSRLTVTGSYHFVCSITRLSHTMLTFESKYV